MTPDLFATPAGGQREAMAEQAVILRGFALEQADELLRQILQLQAQAPFRHMLTPGGFRMSVALTNCGALGWTTDRRGYRYSATDPDSGAPWPAMPERFRQLARQAAEAAGFPGFDADACLLNRYQPGARLSLHQDRNERGFDAPVVSVSLGMSATFLFGGQRRNDPVRRFLLHHGDVAVWGGRDRLRFHGVAPLKGPPHPRLGEQRLNFTFRRAG
ncbi:DNA oxidative demethylase AlkB [Metapseudomonas otitidis]|uniref:DNA oxidative demethylase AlkB n=1 Tax=Metapseudomonas otitidis TaxID=319939 RepID=UPI00227C0F4E|nr:DNA oxidative demethylase AlkB [Pseudomonas otitidis]WAF86931.1 DNA oxidative demethylase AlkB [Pseudomonas otitidis]